MMTRLMLPNGHKSPTKKTEGGCLVCVNSFLDHFRQKRDQKGHLVSLMNGKAALTHPAAKVHSFFFFLFQILSFFTH